MLIKAFYSFLLLLAINAATYAQQVIKETPGDRRAVALVSKLPEVMKQGKETERLSKGKRHLAIYVVTEPTRKDNNYWVDVAEDNGQSLVTSLTFLVDAKTFAVKYYDVVADKAVALSEWRKGRN